ncbi:MAG: hypothetical protein AB8B69_00080 [Chitinophagales bacterium]
MVTYKAIDNFLQSLDKLERKGKKNYLKIRQDICGTYSEIEDVLALLKSDILVYLGDNIVLKTRVPNRTMREGTSSGYRVINLINAEEQEVVFLEVYPKKGKFAKNDLSKNERLALLKEYLEQALEKTLKEVDINDELKIINQETPTPNSDKEEES